MGLSQYQVTERWKNILDNHLGKIAKAIIEDGIQNIGDDAFDKCARLTSVSIASAVTSIGDSAFKSCTSLKSVTIPQGVLEIGHGAFSYCANLSTNTVPNSVEVVDNNAFENTKWDDSQTNCLLYAGNVLYKYKGDLTSSLR